MSRRSILGLLAAGLLVCLPRVRTTLAGDFEAGRAANDQCNLTRWSTPKRIGPVNRFARWPSVAIGTRDSVVVGMDIRSFDDSELGRDPFLAFEFGGAEIERPPTAGSILRPRAVSTPGGVMHLLWGEPATPPKAGQQWSEWQVERIWHATRSDDAWSAPSSLYEGAFINWLHVATAVDANGVLHTTFVAGDSQLDASLYHVAIVNGQETLGRVPLAGGRPLSLASLSSDELILIAAIPSRPGGMGGGPQAMLFSGGTWSSPVPVAPAPGAVRVSWSYVGSAGGDTVHVAWIEEPTGRGRRATLKHATSQDGGHTWSTPDAISLEGLPVSATGAIDGCGKTHMVLQTLNESGSVLVHTAWKDGWRTPRQLFRGWMGLDPVLVNIARNAPLLVFTGARDIPADTLDPAVFVSHLEAGPE